MEKLPDNGNHREFPTGAKRDMAVGKGRYDLIPPEMERRLAIHYEKGAIKYGTHNWPKGIPVESCLDSAKRHLSQYNAGDNTEDHLAAAIFNIACIMHYEAFLPEMMDLPTRRGLLPTVGPEGPPRWAGVGGPKSANRAVFRTADITVPTEFPLRVVSPGTKECPYCADGQLRGIRCDTCGNPVDIRVHD